MAKPSDSPGFNSLLKEWNERLAESGFKDVEEFREGSFQLKKTGSENRYRTAAPTVRAARAQYYEIIGDHLVNTTFDTEKEKEILCLYYEGFSQAEIQRRLGIEGHRSKVYGKIYKWLRAWGLKK